jgi:hypothetical protein
VTDESKSRRLELAGLPRDVPFEGLIYARSAVALAPTFRAGRRRAASLLLQMPRAVAVYFGAPAVISSRPSSLLVSEACWWA